MSTAYDAFASPRIYSVCGWIVFKEYYANGPSMFEWVAESSGKREVFSRRRDAMAHARAHPAEA